MTLDLYAKLGRVHAPERFSLTRRQFVKGTSALAASMLAGACAAPASPSRAAPRVIVVGAGFAGLACASELAAGGMDVTVLEARDRVGGRVHSLPIGTLRKNAEAGAELIGSNHPCWMALAERLRLEFLEVPDDAGLEAPIVLGGRRLAREESELLWEELDAAVQRLNALAEDVNANEPWLSEGAAELDQRSVGAWIDEQRLAPDLDSAVHALMAADNGVATRHQSLLAMLAQVRGGGGERYWTDSEVYRCRGGNQQLAIALARTLPSRALRLRTPAVRIEHAGRLARVACADGQVLAADFVVVALPPTAWGELFFDPPLPARLAPQMGVSVKYVSAVRRRFWRASGTGQYSLSDGEAALTWDPTSGNDAGDEAALTVFASSLAAESARARPGRERREQYERELEIAFPGFASEVTASRFHDWKAEKWTGCGYSFPAPGEVTTVLPLLREVHDGLVFAGEHTSSAFLGYMEGALESGIRTAQMLRIRSNA